MNDPEHMIKDIEMEAEYSRYINGKNSLDSRVLAAMREVPRHEFVPLDLRDQAYCNGPLPIGSGQTISQPYIVALMSDLLNTKPGDVILEVGAGCGYQAAVLSRLVARVYTIEIIENLAKNAAKLLKELGYDNVTVRHGNGYFGWAEHAPFDGVIVAAAAPHVPPQLLEQLRIGSRLVIPVRSAYSHQELQVIEKKANGEFEIQPVIGVSFVPLTGCNEKFPV
ncbi:MAG: protein-L-isoaspartate(D-aspartate) O-methyltransferase [Methylomonas sp.]